MTSIRLATVTILSLLLMTPAQATAQVFGTFSWQMLPYCNVVSLTLVNTPAGFTLQGTDDQCGVVNKAGAFGIASFNTSGNVTANFSIVLAPGGSAVHVSAIISPATGSGTWTDSAGNSGTFALSGATPGLPARPLPPSGLAVASVTGREIAPDAVTGLTVQNGSLTSVDLADAPRASFVEGFQNIRLPVNAHTIVRQVTLTAPAAGRVIVTASAFVSARSIGDDLAQCSLTRGNGLETSFSAAVGDPGFFTARLVCFGLVGTIDVQNSAMTATYFPR